MALTSAYFIMVFLEAFLLCTPVQFNWNKSIDGTCANEQMAFLSAGIINLLIDLIVVLLPMPMLWNLQMGLPKKIGLSAMFGIGLM
jgi:hypothetical protein